MTLSFLKKQNNSLEASPNPIYSRRRVMGSEQEYGVTGDWNLKIAGFLPNGSKLYKDCGHPEYASPETSNPLDAVLYDKAGELIVQRKVKGLDVRLFKNNRDSWGQERFFISHESFASHESYSLIRTDSRVSEFYFQPIIDATLPFFASRIIFAGSGFINPRGEYELSQKAGVTEREVSDSNTGNKGIFNTKDEPLANPYRYRRLHVVSGDANLSEPALFLKFGTTGLVLDLFEDGKLKPFKLKSAIDTFHRISQDLNFDGRYGVMNSGKMTAIEMQRVYHEAAEKAYRGRDDMTDDILNRWKFVLDSLQENPMILNRWLDWVIKKNLIDSYMSRTGKRLSDIEVRNIDLQYHEVNRERGLFYILQSKGMVDRLVTDEQIDHAVENPPEDTRARFRGAFISRFKKNDITVDWGYITYMSKKNPWERLPIELDDPLENYQGLEDKLD